MHLYQLHFDDFEPLAREVSNLLLDESNEGKTQMFKKEKKDMLHMKGCFGLSEKYFLTKEKCFFFTTKSIMLT